MRVIGNFLWFILGGVLMGAMWWLAGALAYLSIVGIPWGRACFVMGRFTFLPFGREAIPRDELLVCNDVGTGVFGTLGNVIWFVLIGVWIALGHVFYAIWCFLTIIGIPFGMQHLKLAGIALAPIGKTIVSTEVARVARRQNAEATLSRLRGSDALPKTQVKEVVIVKALADTGELAGGTEPSVSRRGNDSHAQTACSEHSFSMPIWTKEQRDVDESQSIEFGDANSRISLSGKILVLLVASFGAIVFYYYWLLGTLIIVGITLKHFYSIKNIMILIANERKADRLIPHVRERRSQIVRGTVPQVANSQGCDSRQIPSAVDLFLNIKLNRLDEVERAISLSPDLLDSRNSDGESGVHIAIKERNLDAVALFLENGAAADLQDNNGKTPLDIAKKSGASEIVRLLEGI